MKPDLVIFDSSVVFAAYFLDGRYFYLIQSHSVLYHVITSHMWVIGMYIAEHDHISGDTIVHSWTWSHIGGHYGIQLNMITYRGDTMVYSWTWSHIGGHYGIQLNMITYRGTLWYTAEHDHISGDTMVNSWTWSHIGGHYGFVSIRLSHPSVVCAL